MFNQDKVYGTCSTCSIINQQSGQHFNEPTEKLRTQEEKRQKEGQRAESKRLRHLQEWHSLWQPTIPVKSIRDSRGIVLFLFTWLHNLCRLDWMTKDAAHTTEHTQQTHTQYLHPEGRIRASCLQFLDTASRANCSPLSLISPLKVTIHSPIFSNLDFCRLVSPSHPPTKPLKS